MKITVLSIASVAVLATSIPAYAQGDNNGRSGSYNQGVTFEQAYRSDGSAPPADQVYDGQSYAYPDNYRYQPVQVYRFDDRYLRFTGLERPVLLEDRRQGRYRYDYDYDYRTRLRYDDYGRRRIAHRLGDLVGDALEDLLSGN